MPTYISLENYNIMRHTMGRAPTHPKRLLIAVTSEFLAAVDNWRARQPGVPNRSEAVRYLVEVAALHDWSISILFERANALFNCASMTCR
jgi:hypothetical protein